jgi:hypothetical protein
MFGNLCVEKGPVETTLYSLNDAPPGKAERRDGDRHVTLFRVGSLTIDSHRELCLIKNISAGGMSIRAYCAIPPETRLSVELKCGEQVSGIARWVDGDVVGIAFDEPVDVVDLLATSMKGPRPRMPRVEVDCLAWVREGADTHRVQACDISQGGVKVATDQDLGSGSEVVVSLAGLPPQSAVVRWRDSGYYGITFNKVIALPLLVAWLHEQRDRLRATG